MCMTSQFSGYPLNPAHRPTVAKLAGIKRRERTKSRSQLLCFQWIYERTGARHALFQLRTRVEARSAPGLRMLVQAEQLQDLRRMLDQEIGAPGVDRLGAAEVAPGGGHGAHPGGAPGLHVAQVVTDIDAVDGRNRQAP